VIREGNSKCTRDYTAQSQHRAAKRRSKKRISPEPYNEIRLGVLGEEAVLSLGGKHARSKVYVVLGPKKSH